MPLSTYPTPSSEDEFRAVQFFRERTLAQVSKFFVDELWTTKILQIAHAEPGIWHALISLSSYHELFMKPADSTNNQLVMKRHNLGIYALHHHNMAIKAALDIQRTPKHPLSHLISCVVFVTIEVSICSMGVSNGSVLTGWTDDSGRSYCSNTSLEIWPQGSSRI